ncbi:MFS transporter [Cerasicoccus arenae]|uniref:Major facilitator superfamily (MFS) profile domain-containing protein n=1 Tax=Cerasicoccus arenae TaxID=424488 RepID=A0A8J3GDQ6_9BACT|nr:MFS transporter [Cerasicoccus arenae]MBK1859603.1 MFS transporter [Cerasicoccus arenae]GHC03644.1 hypothetical protein GCM10007047_20330 [Cerasicoccus arenae]
MNPSTTESEQTTKKVRWRVGTLSYTTGGIVVLFFWLLLGDFSWSMRDRSVAPMAQWYLDHLNVSNLIFGLLISSFPALVGLILGPIISVRSDRHRGRWGRRIPYLLITTPLAAMGMLGLAATPLVAKWVHGFMPEQNEQLVALVCFGFFWAAFEFATIAGQSVFGGLINDVVPSTLLGRFYGLFRAISLIDGMIFNYWIMGMVPDYFTLILLIVGLFYGVSFMIVCFKVKEGEYPAPPPKDESAVGGLKSWWRDIRQYFRESFTNRYYLSIFLMLMLSLLSFYPVNIYALPYARSLNIDMGTYGKFLALTYLISLCLSYFLGWISDILHPLRVSMVALLGYFLVSAWGMIYAKTPDMFLTAWVAHGVLSGCYFTSSASLTMRLFPRNKFAQFGSAAAIFAAPATMAIAPLTGMVIDVSDDSYHLVFALGSALALSGFLLGIYVYIQFKRHGGPKNYVAPMVPDELP